MAGTAVLGRLSWQQAEVVDIVAETPRTKTIGFDVPGWPGHRAGQHVDVRLTAEDGYQAERSYSIASAPDGTRVELTVERLDDGEVSPYLTDELRAGDRIELRGPIGGYFVWEPALGRAGAARRGRLGRRTADGDDPRPRRVGQRRGDAPALLVAQLGRRHLPRRARASARRRLDRRPHADALAARRMERLCAPRRHARCWTRSARHRASGRSSSSAARRRSSRPSPRHSCSSDTSRTESRPNASDRREVEMDALMLDGNAVAGLLQEVFGTEMTTAVGDLRRLRRDRADRRRPRLPRRRRRPPLPTLRRTSSPRSSRGGRGPGSRWRERECWRSAASYCSPCSGGTMSTGRPACSATACERLPLKRLLEAVQTPRADHDDGGSDLVGDVDHACHVGVPRVVRASASKPAAPASSAPCAATRLASARFACSNAAAGTTDETVATLSAAVIGDATSRTTERRGPSSSAATSIARPAPASRRSR